MKEQGAAEKSFKVPERKLNLEIFLQTLKANYLPLCR